MIFGATERTLAQKASTELYQQLLETTAQSALIVEGEVIATESFWDENHTRIYTSNLLEVKTKLKGQLASRFIEVLTVGGQVGDDFLMVSHNITIGKGWKGLLFLNQLEVEGKRWAAPSQERGGGRLRRPEGSYRIWDRATYYYDRINPPCVFAHSTVKDIEAELLQPIEKLTAQPRTTFSSSFLRPSSPLVEAARGLIENIELAPTDPETAASSDITIIEYLIDNPQITGTWPKYFELDISVKSNIPGTDFAKGEIWVNYNVDAFGPSIVGSGYLTWNEEGLLATGDYAVTAEDKTIDKVKLKVDHTGSLSTANLTELPVIREAMLHLKIRIDDLNQLADIIFAQDSMNQKSKFRGDGLNPYNVVLAVDEQAAMQTATDPIPLDFEFNSETVVEIGGEQWFETSIMVKGDTTTLLAKATVNLNFNSSVFGNLDDTARWEIMPSGLSLMPNIVVDNLSSQPASSVITFRVKDTVAAVNGYPQYPASGMYTTTTWQELFKIRMRIDQCNSNAGVSFWEVVTSGLYLNLNSVFPSPVINHSPISAIDTFNVVVCPDSIPVIYSVSPKIITAGTFDTLTINGANFGNTIQPIFFENADKGPFGSVATWISPYDQDLIWADSLIKIGISSAGQTPSSTFTWGRMPGSGVVRLDIRGIPFLTQLDFKNHQLPYCQHLTTG